MGTTTLYGWPYPEPTDPVRDGALAAKNTAVAISNSLFNSVGSLGVRGGSSVVTTDVNGAAIIPMSPAFIADLGGVGCVPVAMNGDGNGGPQFYCAAHVPQLFRYQWTVLVKNVITGGPLANTTVRINWLAIGVV